MANIATTKEAVSVLNKKYQAKWRGKLSFETKKDLSNKCLKWQATHKATVRANKASYKARGIGLLHPECSHNECIKVFELSRKISQETGMPHEVDHIIPMNLGGWHHHDNLQILPHKINESKHVDPFWEMVGFKSWKDVPEHLWPEKLKPSYLVLSGRGKIVIDK